MLLHFKGIEQCWAGTYLIYLIIIGSGHLEKKIKIKEWSALDIWKIIRIKRPTSSGYLEKIKIKEPPVLVFHKSRRTIGFQMHLFTHSQALHGRANSNVLSKLPCSCTDWSENSMSMHCVELGTEAWVRAMFVHCLAQKLEWESSVFVCCRWCMVIGVINQEYNKTFHNFHNLRRTCKITFIIKLAQQTAWQPAQQPS